jgi:hypothetical protein
MGRQSTTGVERLAAASRRRTFLSLAILVFLLSGCGNDEEQLSRPSPSPVPSSDVVEYIGKSENFLFFAAVVTHPDGKLTAYFCDGKGRSALFEGNHADGAFSLTSTDGAATLNGQVDETESSGTVQLPDTQLNFTAAKAREMGGLYRLTYSEEGEVTGSSERGNRFEGTVKGSNLSATISTSEEAGIEFKSELSEGVEDQRNYNGYRVIIQDDGDFRGNRLLGATTLSRPNRPVISPA